MSSVLRDISGNQSKIARVTFSRVHALTNWDKRVCVSEIRFFEATSPPWDGPGCAMVGTLDTQNTALFSLLGTTYGGGPRTTDFNGAEIDFSTLELVTTTPVTLRRTAIWGMLTHLRHAGCNGTRNVLPPAPGYMPARLSALRTAKMKMCTSRASNVRRTRPHSVRLYATGIASSVLPPL